MPALPDAHGVSESQTLIASQRRVREFVAAGDAYLACLDRVINDEDRAASLRNAAVEEYNRMVASMERAIAAGCATSRSASSRRAAGREAAVKIAA